MKTAKKWIKTLIGMAVLMALLCGCAHTARDEERSMVSSGSTDTDTQAVEEQEKTNIPAGAAPQDTAVFIDEKLDENLFIRAELKMPENSLYEYSTQLKRFDYDKVQEAIGQKAEGTLDVDDGSDEFTSGALTYQRNDMAAHLDTYCAYADEQGLANDRDLSFLTKAEAAAQMQSLLAQLEVGGELEALHVVAMDQADFENVKKAMMEDDSYQGVLTAKGYESDTFDEALEVYRITFQMKESGIPIYRNEPVLRQTGSRFLAYPATVTVLLSNSGVEMISMLGMLEPYDGQQAETAVIGEDGIKKAIMKKFGDVILSAEYKAVNIWMEYFPLLKENSFWDVDLIPVWCVDFEINGDSVEDSQYTIRFNAITGEEIS